ncbi:MAG: DUF1552 domain-containing protein [Acidimicrobiia bacterium]|nr:DUF1552 domain-containing protein [Acidimicrobiia bacterium]
MIVTKLCLPRRTFLRGMGAAVALPFLDSMVPAFAATPQPVRRLTVAYVPNGIQMEQWIPSADGTAFELTPILQPLAPFRDRLLVVTGLANQPAVPVPGEGTGDHVRAAATFLTGVHPKKTEGPDIRAGISMDQIAARELGRATQLSSLELCLDSNELIGACEAGYSCAYANTLSWRNETTPLPMENQPRAVFERLFGDSDNTTRAARLGRIQSDRSLLDSLVQEVARLQRRLEPGDRAKVTQYLEAIRDIERRIQRAEEQSEIELPAMERPSGGIPDTFAEHARLMFDLQVLAYQCDMTRVTTFLLSREVSPRTYTEIGIPDPHHGLSHHQNNPVAMEKLAKINTYHIQQLAYFLGKLQAIPDGAGTLLDQLTLLYGCGISDSNRHAHDNLPILVIGGAGGSMNGGRHLRVAKDTPLTNLQLALLDKLGVPLDALGDSTGRLELVRGV